MQQQPVNSTQVMSIAGRSVKLLQGEHIIEAKLASRSLAAIPGDLVTLDLAGMEPLVREILPRKNCLARTFSYEARNIAANLDHILLVSAVDKLFNTIAIDRVLTLAASQSIGCTLLINKVDLGREDRGVIYRDLGYEVLETSAKYGEGIDALRGILNQSTLSCAALCGISGVGKSTLLNILVPQANRDTSEVSRKTGQGKQTTSQGIGWPMLRSGGPPLLLIDLPGVQQFGISELDTTSVIDAFPEFKRYREQCEYSDCRHLQEPDCAVKRAIDQKQIAASRYESYRHMLKELEEMPDSRKYRKSDRP
ncbi:MAG: ribosome small subunit-dependent GTPase A [Oligoflexia bacterium]|nr:ribosome small subunit-dependent GTPase A [Oligoflexia bacterium]